MQVRLLERHLAESKRNIRLLGPRQVGEPTILKALSDASVNGIVTKVVFPVWRAPVKTVTDSTLRAALRLGRNQRGRMPFTS